MYMTQYVYTNIYVYTGIYSINQLITAMVPMVQNPSIHSHLNYMLVLTCHIHISLRLIPLRLRMSHKKDRLMYRHRACYIHTLKCHRERRIKPYATKLYICTHIHINVISSVKDRYCCMLV